MEFRLTYEGRLLGSSNTDPRPKHKHEIRRAFHPQLRRLWEVTPHLRDSFGNIPPPPDTPYGLKAVQLADQFASDGFRFVPLVREKLSLLCRIEILFLRPDPPGGLIKSGDIDNRLKTIFDALRIPISAELGGALPEADENPFFVLLEDDKLISAVNVETDILLQPTGLLADANDARLVLKIKLKPYDGSWDNINFL